MKTNKNIEIISMLSSKVGLIVAGILVLVIGYWLGGGFSTSNSKPDIKEKPQPEAAKQWWTCSMDPQLKLPKPGLCPKCDMPLIPLVTDTTVGLRQLKVSEEARKMMDVVVAPVERKFVAATVRMVGKVDFDETRLAYLTAWIPGRLDRLFVDYTGVPVQKGDHMVSIYSPELLTAQEELLQAIKAVKNVQESNLSIMRETAEATVKASREKLRLWGLKPEQIANIEKTNKVSDHITIYAPAGGIVIHKNALEGMYVKEGTRIYTIADLSQVWVMMDAYESDLQWLRYGQEVEFTTVSYPGETFSGTIAFIDPVLNERTRTVKIRVNVSNADGKLKPEMFVKAIVHAQVAAGGRIMDADLVDKWICPMHPDIIKPAANSCDICEMPLVTSESLGYISDDPSEMKAPLVIPVTAALVTGTRAIVYVELSEGGVPIFEGREIVLGPRAGDHYLVLSGLKEGEKVVVKGNFKIDSDLQIKTRPSMMTPDGGIGLSIAKEDIPAVVEYQLKAVVAAAGAVEKTMAEKSLAEMHLAYEKVARSIEVVDGEKLKGDSHKLWVELSMRLTNDCVEGVNTKTIEESMGIAEGMARNLNLLTKAFYLGGESGVQVRPEISVEFCSQLARVYDGYFVMQQALADDNIAKAIEAAEGVLLAVKSVDGMLLTGKEHSQWGKDSSALNGIMENAVKDKQIEPLRKSFYLLSQQLIKLSKHFGSPHDGPFYIFYCSMAFKNSGASWLQSQNKISNPYFGHMMLRCGSVKEVVGVKSIWAKESQ